MVLAQGLLSLQTVLLYLLQLSLLHYALSPCCCGSRLLFISFLLSHNRLSFRPHTEGRERWHRVLPPLLFLLPIALLVVWSLAIEHVPCTARLILALSLVEFL